MPGMDGYQTCRRLKSDHATMHIPVVMVTALGDPTERLQGLEVGADDFLTKPVDYDTLLARVRGLVRLKRLLDEWRVRSETAMALGLSQQPHAGLLRRRRAGAGDRRLGPRRADAAGGACPRGHHAHPRPVGERGARRCPTPSAST